MNISICQMAGDSMEIDSVGVERFIQTIDS